MTVSPTPAVSTHPSTPPSCCATEAQPSRLQKTIDAVCRIAIGIFAAFYAPLPFLASFAIGLATGCIYAVTRLYQNQPMYVDGESKPVCAQGYMDFLSGMRFPPPVGTFATAAFIAAHTRHDPLFYAPFCGLFIGFWCGRQSVGYIRDLTSYAFSSCSQKQPAPCCCKA